MTSDLETRGYLIEGALWHPSDDNAALTLLESRWQKIFSRKTDEEGKSKLQNPVKTYLKVGEMA